MPAGINVSTWVPMDSGTSFQLGATMKPIEDAMLKSKVTVVTRAQRAGGGPHGHTCGISGVLTGVQCKGNSTTNAVSFDEVLAQSFAAQTKFPSLRLGTTHSTENPNAEAGYSTVIKDNLNWSSASTPLSREIEPLKAFNRLFSGPQAGPVDPMAAMNVKDAMRKSILDYAVAEGSGLSARLGTADRSKLDQYLSGLRDLEKRIKRRHGRSNGRVRRRGAGTGQALRHPGAREADARHHRHGVHV